MFEAGDYVTTTKIICFADMTSATGEEFEGFIPRYFGLRVLADMGDRVECETSTGERVTLDKDCIR